MLTTITIIKNLEGHMLEEDYIRKNVFEKQLRNKDGRKGQMR